MSFDGERVTANDECHPLRSFEKHFDDIFKMLWMANKKIDKNDYTALKDFVYAHTKEFY